MWKWSYVAPPSTYFHVYMIKIQTVISLKQTDSQFEKLLVFGWFWCQYFFMLWAQLFVAIFFFFCCFFLFMAQYPFQGTFSTNWWTVCIRVRPNYSGSSLPRLDLPFLFKNPLPSFSCCGFPPLICTYTLVNCLADLVTQCCIPLCLFSFWTLFQIDTQLMNILS